MKPRATIIKKLLKNHLSYHNKHAIDFDILDESMMVSFTDYHNPDHHYIDFFLFYEKKIMQFISDFRIRSTRDLDKITIDQLWELFWRGSGKIYCGLEYSVVYFPVYFKCIDHKLFAIDQQNINQEVCVDCKSIGDFMEYAYLLYQKSSSLPQNSSCVPQSLP